MMEKTMMKRIISIALMAAMMMTMMPMLFVSAANGVEILSPAYGAVVEVGEPTVIRVASESMPTLMAGSQPLNPVANGDGVWDAAWTPETGGKIELTAIADGVKDTIGVTGVCANVVIEEESNFVDAIVADKHWPGATGHVKTLQDGYTTLEVGKTESNAPVPAAVQYATKGANGDATGVGPSSGIVVWESDLRLPENGNTIDLKHRNNTNAANQTFFHLSPSDGCINVIGDADNNWVKRFEADTWFNLKTVFDMDTKTFTVYIDDIAVSVDNTLTGDPAEAIDGLVLQMASYYDPENLDKADTEGSFDIKNWSVRFEDLRSIKIDSPWAGSMQETKRKMPVQLTVGGVLPDDVISVTGSDGATAVAEQVSGNQYVAYLAPQTASTTYTVTASLKGAGKEMTDSIVYNTVDTIQLGAWDFNDPADAGIATGSDNFYAAQKKMTGDTMEWKGSVGGKDATDLAYWHTDTSTANNNASSLSFWPQLGSGKVEVFIMEFDHYYDGSALAVSTSGTGNELYVATSNCIQHPGSWASIAPLIKNTWNHYKCVFNKTTQTFDFYLNGKHISHRVGAYDATSNPTGLKETIVNNTAWIGLPAWAAGNMIVDNINIRALESDRIYAKKAIGAEVMPIGAIKPGSTFKANVGFGVGSKTADLYVNGVKAGAMTKNADGYMQATVTAPQTAGELTLSATDEYGAVVAMTVPVQEPDSSYAFDEDVNNATGWKFKNGWMVWPTAMSWSETDKKVISDGSAASSYQIQAPKAYATGTVVVEFDATVPANGTGNIYPQTRSSNTVQKTLGYIQAGNTGYNDPNNNNAWVYTPNVAAGEQRIRYVFDLATKTTTLYIDGNVVMSYKNDAILDFSGLVVNASAATVTNTLDNIEVFYIAPKEVGGGDIGGGEDLPPVYGVSNAKFTAGRGNEIKGAVEGMRRIQFSADITPETETELQILVTIYQNDLLVDTQIFTPELTVGETTMVNETLAFDGALASGTVIKAFIWTAGTLTPFAEVVAP